MQEAGCEHPLVRSQAVQIRATPYTGERDARGVFAAQPIARGTLIELAPVIRFTPAEHAEHAMRTALRNYTFVVANGAEYFLALGIGSLFNHRDPPNVEYRVRREAGEISFSACRNVDAGEELCIYYGRNLWWESAVDSAEDGATAAEAAADPLDIMMGGSDEY